MIDGVYFMSGAFNKCGINEKYEKKVFSIKAYNTWDNLSHTTQGLYGQHYHFPYLLRTTRSILSLADARKVKLCVASIKTHAPQHDGSDPL
jgi:hypothetical protein